MTTEAPPYSPWKVYWCCPSCENVVGQFDPVRYSDGVTTTGYSTTRCCPDCGHFPLEPKPRVGRVAFKCHERTVGLLRTRRVGVWLPASIEWKETPQ